MHNKQRAGEQDNQFQVCGTPGEERQRAGWLLNQVVKLTEKVRSERRCEEHKSWPSGYLGQEHCR